MWNYQSEVPPRTLAIAKCFYHFSVLFWHVLDYQHLDIKPRIPRKKKIKECGIAEISFQLSRGYMQMVWSFSFINVIVLMWRGKISTNYKMRRNCRMFPSFVVLDFDIRYDLVWLTTFLTSSICFHWSVLLFDSTQSQHSLMRLVQLFSLSFKLISTSPANKQPPGMEHNRTSQNKQTAKWRSRMSTLQSWGEKKKTRNSNLNDLARPDEAEKMCFQCQLDKKKRIEKAVSG